MLPKNFVLVRHGESEGNAAVNRARKGDDSAYTPEFSSRSDSDYRLTYRGVDQAQAAGRWLEENIEFLFQRYSVSHMVRARETAAHLALPNADWRIEYYLSERSWGDLDRMSRAEQQTLYPDSIQQRKDRPFSWRPPNGEPFIQLGLRMDRVISTLVRECSDDNVIAVCHGEVMWGMRLRLEKLTADQFDAIKKSDSPFDEIHNTQILHYTRVDPFTGIEGRRYEYFRSICPWDLTLSSNEWLPIIRKRYTNAELLADVERFPRIVTE